MNPLNKTSSMIQRLVWGILFVIFVIILGGEVADDAPVVLAVLAFALVLGLMLWLGRHAWVLILLLPPLLQELPLGDLSKIYPGYVIAFCVMIYLLVLSMMGHVRLVWRGLWYFDALIGVVFIAFVVQYLRHPVGVNGLGAINGMIGGREYLAVFFASFFYLALSVIPVQIEAVLKLLRVMLVLLLVLTVLLTLLPLIGVEAERSLEDAATSRYDALAALGNLCYVLMLCFASPLQVLRSPWRLLLLALSAAMVMLTGFREQLGRLGMVFVTAAVVRRQFLLSVLLGLLLCGALLGFSRAGLLQKLPFGVQRALSIVPGLKLDREAVLDAQYSWEWRNEMWTWAMDEREGYIKNYWWGDGYGQSVEMLRLNSIQAQRGESDETGRRFFADTGVWHNGPIHMIQRMGYMGLGLMSLLLLSFSYLCIRVCIVYRGHAVFPYLCYALIQMPAAAVLFYVSAGTTQNIIALYYPFALAKLMFCLMREQRGGELSLWGRKAGGYVPLMLRGKEEESSDARGGAVPRGK